MVNRAYALSSTPVAVNDECARLRSIFCRLDYPLALINSSIRKFVSNISVSDRNPPGVDDTTTIRICLPFKGQRSAEVVLASKHAILVIRLVSRYNQFL